ncbi:Rossmann-like fold-containing protein [Polyangium sp. y55x31]|uniref:Rossmann-like fold-containing protein n=1 Tax=Polyangium sp. y55x31 TaxID=3042688 RepID=UPI00248322C9|nr:Rossmann-like fold-containing protein [Polyangium sp. y55x31]MDI1478915.1 DUF2431 domain-containing protein [Polyangium sp. y55x31]
MGSMDGGRQKTVNRPPTPTVQPVAQAVAQGRIQCAGDLRVSSPRDPAEREAEATAKKIMRMAAPSTERFGAAAALMRQQSAPGTIDRKAEGPGTVAPGIAAEIANEKAAGSPLPSGVRRFMEPRFRADFGAVRVHAGDAAAKLARQVRAQAFTVGNHVFFGRDRWKPETSEGKELLAHELTHTIQQGASVQRSAEPSVSERVGAPAVQRLGMSDALAYFADKANLIPGFRLFTIILGVNPIDMSRVERSAANILRGVIEMLPGGGLIRMALDNHGVFERAGAWVEAQIRSLGMTAGVIRDAVSRFLDSLGITDLLDLGGVWQRAKRIFTEPIDRITRFLGGLLRGMVDLVKDAILRPLAGLASQTRGWDLLKAVLGKDPITGDPVPRNAETLIGGFMKLVGQEELWQNLKRANAIPRAWQWFQNALQGLLGLVRSIPSRFVEALRGLELSDIVALPQAFSRVAGVFGTFIADFTGWALNTVWDLLQIVFEVVAPNVMPYLRRAAAAFRTILKDPIGFVGNLVRAGIQGFRQFATNILSHLRGALIGWLTGAMSGANIYIPQALNLREIVKFVLSVLGLTWQNIRQKLVRAVGETAVAAMETGFDIVLTLVREGPAAAWEKIQESLSNLREMVLEQIMAFVRDRIVTAAVTKLVSMLSPAGAFVQAILAIYNTVMFFIERLQQIAQVAATMIDSIAAIAGGAIAAAANRVEQTMARLLTLVISFLARIAGLGKASDAVTNVVTRVRQPIDGALERVIDWIVAQARRLGKFVAQAGVPQDPNTRLRLGTQAAVAAVNRFAGTRVGAAVLTPLLAVIRTRYGFTVLEVIPVGGKWHVRAIINPQFVMPTEAMPTGSVTPTEETSVLLVGEGNFTFALSIAGKMTLGGRLVATDFTVEERKALKKKSKKEQRRDAAVAENVAALQAMDVEVERQVDACDPTTFPQGTFDVIVFNHPFVLTKKKDKKTTQGNEEANIALISQFLAAAMQRIREGGRIIIISSMFRLRRWKLHETMAKLGLDHKVQRFVAEDFPGYVHEKTRNSDSAETVKKSPQLAITFTVRAQRTT